MNSGVANSHFAGAFSEPARKPEKSFGSHSTEIIEISKGKLHNVIIGNYGKEIMGIGAKQTNKQTNKQT